MTGWGQDGPLAKTAGHDINYIALTGALDAIGRKDGKPTPPLNLIGDYGGGGMFLAMGILAAIINVKNGGTGQVVDAAMVDGASVLMTMFYSFNAFGHWSDQRESNLLDGGAHFYDTYECSDGKFMSVGSIEPQFYSILLEKLGINDEQFLDQMNKDKWEELSKKIAETFKKKTREEWTNIFDGTDACVAPILNLSEAPNHPHLKSRNTFLEVDNYMQPAPAPRFSNTKEGIKNSPQTVGQNNDEVCQKYNLDINQFKKKN